MNNEDYINLVESVSKQILDKIDFKHGIVQERSEEMRKKGCALDVRWKMNVHLILYINKWNGDCWYYVERNGEQVSPSHYGRKYDDQFFHFLQHLVNEVPYDYKTLLEESRDNLSFCTGYDIESFNGYHFKSIEWVKVKPKFYERKHRGMLIEDDKIYHDAEQEFLDLMNKYAIPYEYDEVNEVYTIYGYKR